MFRVACLGSERDQGGEHVIYNYADKQPRVFKVTHPGKAGLGLRTIRVAGEWQVAQKLASPLDYLRRWVLTNEIFGDSVRFEGVIDGDLPSLVISQPKIEGSLPEPSAINRLLLGLGFVRTDLLMWFRPEDGIAISDTKRANFIETPDGDVLPIDVLIQRATMRMREAWGFA